MSALTATLLNESQHSSPRAAKLWGVAARLAQTPTPLLFWWLDTATVYAIGTVGIAFIYVGFAVADGRPKLIAVESGVALGFMVLAAVAVSGSPWLVVTALAGHGLKDLWLHRTHFVANTRWWPPICTTVDFVVATISRSSSPRQHCVPAHGHSGQFSCVVERGEPDRPQVTAPTRRSSQASIRPPGCGWG